MKKSLIAVLLAGVALAGCQRKEPSKPVVEAVVPAETALGEKEKSEGIVQTTAEEKPREMARDVKDGFSRKATEWKLSSSDIEAELEKTGRVVREKPDAGEKTGDAADNGRLATLINIKFGADSHLFASKIAVEVDRGVATLKGTVKSTDAIGRAVYLALDTEGVGQVISLLTTDPNK
jgi:hypothetical protein